MFRKSIVSAVTIAVLGISTATLGTTAAMAGGKGHHGKHGHHGHHGHGHHRHGYHGHKFFTFQVYKAPNYGYWQQHLAWCQNHYRSFRAFDNTFQPIKGRRRVCISPFYGG